MESGKYTLVNGRFIETTEYLISIPEAEAVHFSEKIRAVSTSFPFFKETLTLIKLKLLLFNFSYPEFTENDGAELKRQLQRTLTKNKHFLGAALKITFRHFNNKVSYSIVSEKLPSTDFELNEKGLFLALSESIQKPISPLSGLSIGSEIYWEIVKTHMQNENAHQFLIINTENQILETPESNIYLINGKSVRTSNIAQGAYLDITRPLLIAIFENMDFEFSDEKALTIIDVENAEEIFIVNAIEGIRWIVGFGSKRYFNNTIRKISELFSERLIQ